jgi:hypothetical protein
VEIDREIHRIATRDPVTMMPNQAQDARFEPLLRSDGAQLQRQVKQQVIMRDVGLSFALTHPHASPRHTATEEHFLEPLADASRAFALVIVKRHRQRPHDGDVSPQWEPDLRREGDRFEQIASLRRRYPICAV